MAPDVIPPDAPSLAIAAEPGVAMRRKLGVAPHQPVSSADVAAFDAWLGRRADNVTVFGSWTNWGFYISSLNGIVAGTAGDARPKVWTIGLNVAGTTLDQAASGDFDTYYTQAARIIAAAPSTSDQILVRVGHEFNLDGPYPWRVVPGDRHEEYKAAFRRFVSAFRAVSPRFRFVWNPNWTSASVPQYDVTQAYPGDDVVDVIGLDLYYDRAFDDPNPATAFNYARTRPFGLQWQVDFAGAHGKAMCLCEFGTNWDRPEWIDLVYQWVTRHDYAYAAYWDNNLAFSGKLSDGRYPDSGARFRSDFRDHGPIPLFNHTFFWTDEGFRTTGTAAFDRTGSVAEVTGVSNFSDRAIRTWRGLTIGATYRVVVDIDTGNLPARVTVAQPSGAFTTLGAINPVTRGLTRRSFTFVARSRSVLIRFTPYSGNATQVVRFDNLQLIPE